MDRRLRRADFFSPLTRWDFYSGMALGRLPYCFLRLDLLDILGAAPFAQHPIVISLRIS